MDTQSTLRPAGRFRRTDVLSPTRQVVRTAGGRLIGLPAEARGDGVVAGARIGMMAPATLSYCGPRSLDQGRLARRAVAGGISLYQVRGGGTIVSVDDPAMFLLGRWLVTKLSRSDGEIAFQVVGADVWVVPDGDLDMGTIAEFELALADAAALGQRYVFVDLAKVIFIDAAGIGALARAANALESQGRRLKLFGASDWVQSILDLTGMNQFLGVEANLLGESQRTES